MTASKAAIQAERSAVKYASKQHRFRAETIVHTELARAYNFGAHEGIQLAQRAGLMGVCEMVWSTAGTNRVCSRCLDLKGTVVGRSDESGMTLPPLHPRCRCTIEYRELTNKPAGGSIGSGVPAVSTSGISVRATPLTAKEKAEMERLRRTLAAQRAQNATASEVQTTIKSAGRLVVEKVRATEFFNLPSSQKIDEYKRLTETHNDFVRRLNRVRGKISRQEYSELYRICRRINYELMFYQAEAAQISKTIQKNRAEQVRAILSSFRPMGATAKQLWTQFTYQSREDVRRVVETALNFYPSDWVTASVNRGAFTLSFDERGSYNDYAGVLVMDSQKVGKIATAVHELGHRMSHTLKEIFDAETAFYARRTAGEQLKKLSALTGNPNYKDHERVRKDKFVHVYMGRDYGGRAYELVSMGFQFAYTEPETLLRDEDMAQWIYGLLCLI